MKQLAFLSCVLALLLAAAGALSAEITQQDAAMAIQSSTGTHLLPVGKTLQLSVRFANPQAVNARAQNDQVSWQVQFANGKAVSPSLARINGNGLLWVSGKARRGISLTVTAVSRSFGTKARFAVLAYPPVKSVVIRPSGPVAFTGGRPVVLQAQTDPPGLGRTVVWKAGKKNVAAIRRNADGTVSVYPGEEGVTRITATAPDGAKGETFLRVHQPVTGVEILGGDYVRKGEGVVLTARLTPKGASIRGVTWSLDVDESLATIDKRGRVKPTAQCPVGTVITVTCRPKGTDRNVYAVKEVVVTYPRQKID